MSAPVIPIASAPRKRFYVEAGSDQIVADGRRITHDEAAAMVEGWWFDARRFDHEGRRWAADACTEAADELAEALTQALRYARCMDGHPLAYVGRPAFAECVELINPQPPESVA
jgi:hypothetical protein